MTTPTGNGDCADDRRLTVAHLITVDSACVTCCTRS